MLDLGNDNRPKSDEERRVVPPLSRTASVITAILALCGIALGAFLYQGVDKEICERNNGSIVNVLLCGPNQP